MLNSSFEPPKRSPRSVNSNNIPPPSEIQVFNVNYENPASFGKKKESLSTDLIPPWIKSSFCVHEKRDLFGEFIFFSNKIEFFNYIDEKVSNCVDPFFRLSNRK